MFDTAKFYEIGRTSVREMRREDKAVLVTSIDQDSKTYSLYLGFDKPIEDGKTWSVFAVLMNTETETVELLEAVVPFDNLTKNHYLVELTYDCICKNPSRFVEIFIQYWKDNPDTVIRMENTMPDLASVFRMLENDSIFKDIKETSTGFSNPYVHLYPWQRKLAITVELPGKDSSTYSYNIIDFDERHDPETITKTLQRACDCIFNTGIEKGRANAKTEILNWLQYPAAKVVF